MKSFRAQLAILALFATTPVLAQSGSYAQAGQGQPYGYNTSNTRTYSTTPTNTRGYYSGAAQGRAGYPQNYQQNRAGYGYAQRQPGTAAPGYGYANSQNRAGYQTSAQSQQAQGSKAAAKEFNFADTIVSSGITRRYQIHVPPGYDRSKPIPVVMVFHGLGGDGSLMLNLTQMNIAANKKNFVVVYPDGINRRWDDGARVNTNDIQFVSEMLNKIARNVNIDRRRIYAVGYSNGGHFVMYMACQSNILAGMAINASAMITASANGCSNTRIPAIFFLGTADPLVPSDDAEHNATLGKLGDAVGLSGLGTLSAPMARMGGVMSAEDTVEFWVHHNQDSPTPYSTQMPDVDPHDGTKVTKNTYGSYSSEVVHYRILGGGHTWPGAIYNGPSDVVGTVSHDIDATDIIADFFMRH